MKRLLIGVLVYCLLIPAILWGIVLMVGSDLPEKREIKGLNIPRPEPREGYEIIYPYETTLSGAGSADFFSSTFYYLSTKRQVIYRYDAERYLELQGENCEGLIWYHDEAKNIHTRIDLRFFTRDKLPTFNYYNPGKRYIGIPTNDMSSVMFSIDGGKTFIVGSVTSFAAVPGEQVERFIGMDDSELELSYDATMENDMWKRYQKPITISGDTGYFILKNGDVLFGETVFYHRLSSEPLQRFHSFNGIDENLDINDVQQFGKYWEIYQKPAYLERLAAARNIQVEPYQGWDKIRCEVGAER